MVLTRKKKINEIRNSVSKISKYWMSPLEKHIYDELIKKNFPKKLAKALSKETLLNTENIEYYDDYSKIDEG